MGVGYDKTVKKWYLRKYIRCWISRTNSGLFRSSL